MRHPNEKHRVLASIGGGVVKGAAWMLLKHIVDVLHARDVTLANAIHTFVKPADCRSQRNPVIPDFSFGL